MKPGQHHALKACTSVHDAYYLGSTRPLKEPRPDLSPSGAEAGPRELPPSPSPAVLSAWPCLSGRSALATSPSTSTSGGSCASSSAMR
eukprot:CAMPEP_0202909168 /NCGR_PEP_ID=MMETSP1392-20130828/48543_1 /ASSEMBLY_ACC=CAM_ASM_000868 /TAXON_ID=225041 /ORGANISM="Chlamydomonas chlamydogama, Strain SAG 11-48b" /LENGTH=87 /DNA_ID=CAMNT_0049598831 /DNA_START=468 /DNA_END=728 /DNA_ORIENTATION=-